MNANCQKLIVWPKTRMLEKYCKRMSCQKNKTAATKILTSSVVD